MLEDEVWKSISSYPNYEISNQGRVFNVKYNRPIRPFYKDGYEYVSLYKDGKSTDVRVNRLVAQAFLPFCLNGNEVNHDDGDRSYNSVDNLEWVTRSENMLHSFRNGRIASNRRSIKIVETNEVFESLTACAHLINGDIGAISRCLSGTQKTHRGVSFEFVD